LENSVAITYHPIGYIRSPWLAATGAPIQPAAAADIRGSLEIAPEFAEGLRDLDGFSHVIVLWHMHLVCGHNLTVVPFLDTAQHGIFATRSPRRPNPLAMSVYRLLGVAGTTVAVSGVDAVDGTPIVDIKPFVPAFDAPIAERIGWFAGRLADVATARADDRFSED
jgi:tRNA-Thr(GGU) m(6)t(6)A37 methyltransferase TsaA